MRYLVGLLVLVLFTLGCGPNVSSRSNRETATGKKDSGVPTHESVLKGTDVPALRAALTELNANQGRPGWLKVPPLDDAGRKSLQDLRSLLNLDEGEVKELESSTFTRLDGHYLDQCLLFRDAARALGADELPVADKAAIAFGWVMRQVRLGSSPDDLTPPHFVLRRGWGSARERGMVFLSLLHQLDCQACLLPFSAKEGEPHAVCGVLDGNEVLLFDTYLGLPLPGPKDKGIATLTTIKQQPHLLAAFALEEKYHYETAPSKIQLVIPLSALAPRMKYLQEELRATGQAVKLADDARAQLDAWKSIKEPGAEVLGPAARSLRRFLPPDEGGIDLPGSVALGNLVGYVDDSQAQKQVRMGRKQLYELEATPWIALPLPLRKLPWNADIFQMPRTHLMALFIPYNFQPQGPREQLVRGQVDDAGRALVRLRDAIPDQRERLRNLAGAPEALADWCTRAELAYVKHLEAREGGGGDSAKPALDRVVKEGQQIWSQFIEGFSADLRLAKTTYLLALCMHELAERQQVRLRVLGDKATAADRQKAENAWNTARSWWDTLASEFPFLPIRVSGNVLERMLDNWGDTEITQARLLRAEARQALGEHKSAAELLEDLSGRLTDFEKAARRYQAQRLKKQ